jgi:hypothetical protein
MSMAEQHEWLQRGMTRRRALQAVLVTGAGLATPMLWSKPARAAPGTGIRGRHIAYGADPQHEMIVSFVSDSSFASARVEATSAAGGASADVEVHMVPGSRARYCRSILTNLRADSEYQYQILLDGTPAGGSTLRTAPAGPIPFRFTAFGDQGTGDVPGSVLPTLAALKPRLHLLAGDICYADQSGLGGPGDTLLPALWDRWLDQNDPIASTIPWMAVPGNHEMEPGFGPQGYAGLLARVAIGGDSPLAVPVASRFRVGSVGFIGLDSNDVSYEIPANRQWTQGKQTAWLEETLARWRSTSAGVDFIVAFMHASPYSMNEQHASEGGIRQAWVPLFDKYQVDLVISGHNHCYERSLPLRGDVVTSHRTDVVESSTGTTYVTAGGGGANTGTRFITIPKTRLATANGIEVVSADWSIGTRLGDHGVLSVDVEPAASTGANASMTLRWVAADGTVIDRAVLQRPSALRAADGQHASQGDIVPWLVGGGAVAGFGVAGAAMAVHRRRRGRLKPEPTPDSGRLDRPDAG